MATWYRSESPYRVKITFTNPDALVEDDSYLVEVDTATLVSARKCRADCYDIVFCKSDEPTPLTRYILPRSQNTANTKFYIRIPNVSLGDTDIYMYYGSLEIIDESSLVEFYKELKGTAEVTSSGGGYYREIYKEVVEDIDGTRKVFTVEDEGFLDNSLAVVLRGQQLRRDIDFWESTPSTGIFEMATPPYLGDTLWTEYYLPTATPLATPLYWWSRVNTDSGSILPSENYDTLNIRGGEGIITSATGKTVTVEFATPITPTDELVKASDDDTTASTLDDKLVAGTDISLTVLNPGGNEQIEIAYTGSGGGAWEVIGGQTISGSAVSRVTFSGITESDYYCFELKLMITNPTVAGYFLLFFNGVEFYSDASKLKRQKYYATNTRWTLGQEITPFIGGAIASGETFTMAEFSHSVNGDVYAKLENIAPYDAGGYPRAYISFSRYINVSAISSISIVAFNNSAVETAMIGIGSNIILLGLKK